MTPGSGIPRPTKGKRAADLARPQYRLMLAGVLLVAAALRLWSIGFGLPLQHARPDERTLVSLAMQFGSGDLNPHVFQHPSLFPYLLFVCYGASYALGIGSGTFATLQDFVAHYDLEPGAFLVASRLLAALMGIATVYFTARLTERMFDRRTAVLAALVLGLTFLHVRDSHFGAPEVPVTLFVVISMLFIVRTLERGRNVDYLLAGLFAGLATSTRYGGACLVFPMLFAHAADLPGRGMERVRGFVDVKLCGFLVLLGGAFLAGTPFALLDFSAFLRDLGGELPLLESAAFGGGWIQHATVSLWYGMGWPLWLVALGGFVLLFRTSRRDGLLLAAFPAAYYLFAGGGHTVLVHGAIPLLPFLAIAAAVLLQAAGDQIASHSGWPRPACALGAALLALVPSIARSLSFDHVLGQRDNRLVVLDWLGAHVPPGSSIAQTAPGSLLDGLQWGRVPLQPSADRLSERLEALVAEGKSPQKLRALVQYLRSPKAPPAFDEWQWQGRERGFTSLGEPVQGLPSYVLVARHPLRGMPEPDPDLRALLKAEYKPLQEFRAVTAEPGANVFDEQDAFFVPLAGFRDVERPGPNYELYARGGFSAVASR